MKFKIADVPAPPHDALQSYIQEQEKWQKEFDKGCVFCTSPMRPHQDTAFYGDRYCHRGCLDHWTRWTKDWVETWAQIGWHARADLTLGALKCVAADSLLRGIRGYL